LVVLLGAVSLVVYLLASGGGPLGKKKEPPIPTLEFAAKVSHIPQGKAPGPGTQKAEGDRLVKMFDDFYQTAFVDPHKWGDGTFPDLADLFAKDAKASFTKDIGSLTIGDARTELKRVDLTTNDLGLTLYYDASAKPTFAVAAVHFIARGTLKQAGPPVTIRQTATFYLQRQGGDWKITAYDANESQETPTPSPTPSGSPT
jgi:ketosteroid isomerase-like protein